MTADDERRSDEVPTSSRLGRAFMVTGGRTTSAAAEELPVETVVVPRERRRRDVAFERRRILDEVAEPRSVAEIAALLDIPLLAAQVVVSEMVADHLLDRVAEAVDGELDVSLLLRIRERIEQL